MANFADIVLNLCLVHLYLSQFTEHYDRNVLIKQTGSYYVITDFDHIWDISQLYPVYLDDITVITLDLNLV